MWKVISTCMWLLVSLSVIVSCKASDSDSDNEVRTLYEIDERIEDPKMVKTLLICSDDYDSLSSNITSMLSNIDSMTNLEEVMFCISDSNELNRIFEKLSSVKSIKRIELARLGIHNIPDAMYNVNSLLEIDISENNLFDISDSLCNLTHVTTLNLAFNHLSSLPDGLLCLENLENLSLFYNQIRLDSLFCQLSHFPKLRTLIISGNIVDTGFSCFATFPNLEKLVVDFGQADVIRKNASYFPSLKILEEI